MWVFLAKAGFFSVVQNVDDAETVVVRARCRDDLVRLGQLYLKNAGPIVDTPTRDYAHRLFVGKKAFADAIAAAALDIDIFNFKNATSTFLGPARAALYGRVWSVLLDLQRPRSTENEHGGSIRR